MLTFPRFHLQAKGKKHTDSLRFQPPGHPTHSCTFHPHSFIGLQAPFPSCFNSFYKLHVSRDMRLLLVSDYWIKKVKIKSKGEFKRSCPKFRSLLVLNFGGCKGATGLKTKQKTDYFFLLLQTNMPTHVNLYTELPFLKKIEKIYSATSSGFWYIMLHAAPFTMSNKIEDCIYENQFPIAIWHNLT